ncbi:MAG: UDP-3-O-(3-hydroxymyristoyl)glucosamine N-acyltransferase [Candidatus Eisenbacteria bacterium]
MQITLSELADVVGGRISGDGSVLISGVAGIKEARQGDVTFLANPRYGKFLETTAASAVIAPTDTVSPDRALILCENPYLSFVKAVEYFVPNKNIYPRTIHPSAVVAPGVKMGNAVGIGACAVIEDGVTVGDDSLILAGAFVGRGSTIGNQCLVYQNVTIREEVTLGDRVIVHCGAVIGSDGFGFARDGEIYRKIPQIGNVVIESDVEIGANVTIDRATTGTTRVGKGTKIDNLVQIAHNVVIGENSVLVAQVGIGGSTEIGKGVSFAGQSGTVGHIKIGDGAMIGAQTGVTQSVPANTMVSGYPAREHGLAKRIYASLKKLPDLLKKVSDLAERVARLEEGRKE